MGFKSFADKTELEFTPGIAIFAGPNGSGKSNVSDAVRFCLGEQSAKVLRATRMDEMIFGGSRSRKALGMAEVTMVFDNSDRYFPLDFSEIAITRRTFRGGDTQYFINKSQCRWRDIQELFMDTGIGRGALCLVGGREVDLVLSSNPQDRRMILEETAGVNKYFFRKKEAARKLEQTAANLCRLKDIHGEVQASLKAAEVQVARFNRFRKYQEKLAAQEIKALKSEARSLVEEKARRAKLLESVKAEISRLAGERSARNAVLESLRADHESLGIALEKYRHGLAEISLQGEHLRQEMAGLDERLQESEREGNRAQEHVASLNRRLGQLDEETEALRTDLEKNACEEESVTQTLRGAEERLGHLNEKLEAREPALTALKKELESLARERLVLKARLENLAHVRSRLQERIRRAGEERENLDQARRAHIESESEERSRVEAASAEITAAVTQRDLLKSQIEERESVLQECNRKITAARDALVQYSSKLAALKDVVDSYADYFPGVRFLMARRSDLPGIVGTLADLITVPLEYERSIEVSLASHIQDLVATTSGEARRCLDVLKREKAGRATFWPLDVPLRTRAVTGAAKDTPGVIGWAKQLIEFDKRIDGVLENLLGKTLVVKDIDTALAYYRRGARDTFVPTLVSLDGDVLSPSGSMTGGVTAHTKKGILTKKRETEELDSQVKQLTERKGQLEESRKVLLDEINTLTARFSSGEGAIRALEMKKRVASDEAHDQARKAAEAERAIARLGAQSAESEAELEEVTGRERETSSGIEGLGPGQTDLESRIVALSGELEAEQAERDALLDLLSGKRIALARVAEKQAALREKAALYATRREEIIKDTEQSRLKIEGAAREKERLDERRRDLDVERSRLTLKSGGFENLIAQTQSERERMKERQEQQARDLEEIAAQGDETRERMHRLDIEIAQIDTQTSDLMARLEERGESSASIDWQAVAILNSEETQKELARLRQSIASFGGVNLGALEDYEKLKERNDFLSLQMKDLEDASQSLKDVIAQMDEASSRQFQAAFLEVNARFSDLFTDLFNGGTAQLELSDPSNLLETGVEIVARPPGKKLQNLMLLSSGERALTATAFLMALLKVKPSPFVILDELDAPLDDANVERVAGKIKEFSESSQFIIITHNRKTMEYGSALYGVTMEEAGVSRLVSLNLEETSREKRASSSDLDLIAY